MQTKSLTHKALLLQLIKDWGNYEKNLGVITGFSTSDVKDGRGGLAGTDIPKTYTAPRIYISELQGCPYYNLRGFLVVGYRIRFTFKEVKYDEATEHITNYVESMMKFFEDRIYRGIPISTGEYLQDKWVDVEFSKPFIKKTLDLSSTKDEFSSGAYLDIKIILPTISRRRINFSELRESF